MRGHGHPAVTVLVAMLLVLAAPVLHAMEPSDLAPADETTPVLTLVHAGETRDLSLADIERLDLYEAELEHFDGLTGVFTGVRLDEFVVDQGLADAQRLRFIAADDYTIFLEPDAIAERRILLATRFDGEPIPRTQLGPLLLVVPDEVDAVLAGELTPTDWVWSLTEIHAR